MRWAEGPVYSNGAARRSAGHPRLLGPRYPRLSVDGPFFTYLYRAENVASPGRFKIRSTDPQLPRRLVMRFNKSLAAAAFAVVASTAAIAGASAQNAPAVPGDPGAAGAGPAMGRGHRHGDPARHEHRMEQRVSRMVTQVGATAEQRDRIVAIMKAAMADQAKLREQGRALRAQGIELLKAPSIDRPALEKHRAERLALFDALSRRMTTALADAAEVLTPEQRVKFAELSERRGWRGRGPHGHHGHGAHGGPDGHPGPGSTPGAAPGSTPGAMPGAIPGASPGAAPGTTPDSLPGGAPGVAPPAERPRG
jgi:Spy/CpxP family protein refolding chaperone